MPWCMDCQKMNYKKRCGSDAKCELKEKYYSPYSVVCDDYYKYNLENNIYRSELERLYRSTDPEYIQESKENQNTNSSSCYLTTAICNCLNYEDDCNYLETLRYFRDKIMLKNQKYYDLLAEYDIIGPLISKSLMEDKNNKHIATALLINYIVPVYFKINNHKYNEATKIYINMVNTLKEFYGYNNLVITKKDNTQYPKIKTKKDIHKLSFCYEVKRVFI